ncbi:LysR family transcriptional regulator [Actinoplanes xinjiangensis]|uniref:DNA-binding transcriptional LysR family regulator n=1 Tax=Actinoplanes xinjiangensis TaxID=512350 RepID=A0A316FJM9_9ACTN|nr:LysR family transcriptional regulator [Actinoplanes xinjiangensis]PWK47980.1 DNA-binding transcriptional LysR family regulator [Actinoplanes xinjiangensis]GIF39270.1 LysR family transcriptional regulator [Actinoplanes xinjiangensis]
MELRQLAYFVAVAEEQHFTRAAARLHVVQSAVSAAIKTLERELGAPLLDRNAKRVRLTDAGLALLPRARVALDAARDARDAVAEVRGGLRGTLRIGTLTSIRVIDVPALLGEYHRRHPGVLLQTAVSPMGSRGLIGMLAEHRLDLAFVSVPGPRPAGVHLVELASAVMDLAVPADHPLAGRPAVSVEELAGLDFIDLPAGYGNRDVADRAFAAASVRRNVTIEITDIGTSADYVRHGLGVALLPRFLLAGGEGLTIVPVTGADLRWPLSLAVPADRPPGAAARALISLTADFLPDGDRPVD